METSEKKDSKPSTYITKEEALEIFKHELKALDENFFTSVIGKITEKAKSKFSADEFNKAIDSSNTRVEKLKKDVLEEISIHLKKTEAEFTKIGNQIKEDTEKYFQKDVIEQIKKKRNELLFEESKIKDELKENRKKLLLKEDELQKKEDSILLQQSELEISRERQRERENEIDKKSQEVSERLQVITTKENQLANEISKYKKLKLETDIESQELEKLKGASTEMLSKLVPSFISKNEELDGFFKKISGDSGQFEGQALLLVAQLKMLDSFLQTGEVRNLKNCLKEIGRAIFSYCYENKLDIEDVPRKLAEAICSNSNIQDMHFILDIPYIEEQVDNSWMVDLTEGRRSQAVRRVLTWAIRDSERGVAITKAEIES